jgi:5-methylcytosine-specific restriction endonuclease McrA
MEQATEKPCSKCGEVKPLGEFSPAKNGPLGRQSSCKACYRAYRAANGEKNRASQAKYYRANREKIRARQQAAYDPAAQRAYYLANRDQFLAKQAAYRAENAEVKKARDAAYRAEHQDEIRAYQERWREENRDYLRHKATEWMKANPERVLEIQRRRRARKRGATIGEVDLGALWTGFCGLCDSPLHRFYRAPHPESASIDHIVPLALGGAHAQHNLQWAHLVCNYRKGARYAG